jgi:hypothetical protein
MRTGQSIDGDRRRVRGWQYRGCDEEYVDPINAFVQVLQRVRKGRRDVGYRMACPLGPQSRFQFLHRLGHHERG